MEKGHEDSSFNFNREALNEKGDLFIGCEGELVEQGYAFPSIIFDLRKEVARILRINNMEVTVIVKGTRFKVTHNLGMDKWIYDKYLEDIRQKDPDIQELEVLDWETHDGKTFQYLPMMRINPHFLERLRISVKSQQGGEIWNDEH